MQKEVKTCIVVIFETIIIKKISKNVDENSDDVVRPTK
jgi:hypothetical protein